jgi:3-hydroxybutyrate dehydrogenase
MVVSRTSQHVFPYSINNTGASRSGTIDTFPDDEWDHIIAVNLSAPFHLTKRCLPAMKKKG